MKFVRIFLAAAAAWAPAAAGAQMLTVGEAQEIFARGGEGSFAGRAEQGALVFYLQGMVEGAMGYHGGLKADGKAGLFCPPEGAGNSLSLKEVTETLAKIPADRRGEPASAAFLAALKDKYPCRP
jgi:hypothetical protein